MAKKKIEITTTEMETETLQKEAESVDDMIFTDESKQIVPEQDAVQPEHNPSISLEGDTSDISVEIPLPTTTIEENAPMNVEENSATETIHSADLETALATPSQETEKPKRGTRRKKKAAEQEPTTDPDDKATAAQVRSRNTAPRRTTNSSVLTIESRAEVETPDDREEIIWHEIRNAYRTRKILTGTLGGIEQLENGKTIAIVYYKEMRIIIPMKEMMINLSQENSENYGELMVRQSKILGTMLGAEIDFIVKGIDSNARSVVASRKDAMLRKRQLFYMETDTEGMYRIYEDRIVQARVIAVAEKVIRIEAFGVECAIMARDLSWDWLGDAHEKFSVGDQILVRILNVKRDNLEDISIKADVKSVSANSGRENLKKCRVQGKYAGKVTDIHKGTVFVRLSIGVNAIAHSCYDNRMPGKKDDVSFAVTHIDEERGVAVGIITRIIKQNL